MTTPTSTIKASDIALELGLTSTTTINLNSSSVRGLAKVPSGAISFTNLKGKTGFNQSEGAIQDGGATLAEITISCNRSDPVTWSFIKTGHAAGITSVANNASATSVLFSLSSSTGFRQTIWTVTATNSSSVVYNWTVTLEVEGSGGS